MLVAKHELSMTYIVGFMHFLDVQIYFLLEFINFLHMDLARSVFFLSSRVIIGLE